MDDIINSGDYGHRGENSGYEFFVVVLEHNFQSQNRDSESVKTL